MKKLTLTALGLLLLSACGSGEYDEVIDSVLEHENEALSKPDVVKDIDEVNRENTEINVYDDGQFVEIEYQIREDFTSTWLYEIIEHDTETEFDRHADYQDVQNPQPNYSSVEDGG